jgi:hypothetical protein
MRKTRADVFSGFTGKIGNTGFYKRVLNGVEVIQQCPTRKTSKRDKTLPGQNLRFRQAVRAAALALTDPEIRSVYARVATGTCSANSMYIKDFFHPAVISGVDVSGYEGQRGFRFNIRIDNIVPVKSVTVSIVSATGQVLESGQAGSVNRGDEWSYQTGSFIPDLNGAMLQVTAVDIPGHTASRNIPL